MRPKLLLADDSVTIQRVIELTFADEDVQVLTVGDGEQAIQRVEADRPDIVLADIGMPKRSGYEVAAFIKGHPDLSHIPVLLLTGAFEPVDEGRAHAAGCDGVLVKPFEPQHVIARVRELLQGAGGRSTTRAVADVPRPVERLASHRALEMPPRYDTPVPAPRPAGNPSGQLETGGSGGSERGANESALDDYFDRLDAAFANIGQGTQPAPRHPDQVAHDQQVVPRPNGPVMEKELDWFDSPSHGASDSPPSQHGSPPQQSPTVADHEPPQDVSERPANPGPARETAHAVDLPTTLANPPSAIDWPVPGVVEGLTGGIRHPERPPPEPPDQSPTLGPEPTAPAVAARPPDAEPVVTPPAARAAPAATMAVADAFSALLAVEQGEPGAAPVRLVMAQSSAELTDEVIEEITRRVIARLGPGAVKDVVSDVVAQVAERLVREEIGRLRQRNA
jgi:CheY-like chemotaxis protein